MVTGNGIQFVATSSDDKTKLHCRDTAHDDYANPPTPTTSYTAVINVYCTLNEYPCATILCQRARVDYQTSFPSDLEAPMTQKNMTLNPEYVNELKCAVSKNLPEGKEVMYSWQKFGKVMDEETDAVLKISVTENVTEEDVSCTASVDEDGIKREYMEYCE